MERTIRLSQVPARVQRETVQIMTEWLFSCSLSVLKLCMYYLTVDYDVEYVLVLLCEDISDPYFKIFEPA